MNNASITMPGSSEPLGELHPLGGQLRAQPQIAAHEVPLPDAQT